MHDVWASGIRCALRVCAYESASGVSVAADLRVAGRALREQLDSVRLGEQQLCGGKVLRSIVSQPSRVSALVSALKYATHRTRRLIASNSLNASYAMLAKEAFVTLFCSSLFVLSSAASCFVT